MKSFEKQMIARMGSKPTFKTEKVLRFTMPCDQVIKLDLLKPLYQADLDQMKVNEMVASNKENPHYFVLKAQITCASHGAKLYLMDGQHRFAMMKQTDILYPCDIIIYKIVDDDEMRQLFCEINKDSYKNMAYISLPIDVACLVDEITAHYSTHEHFTKTKSASKLFTLKVFLEKITDYLATFQTSIEAIADMEKKQVEFMNALTMNTYYAEEATCIKSKFIMPLKNCNFTSYLTDQTVHPLYTGKGMNKVEKPCSVYKSVKISVWDHYIGNQNAEAICTVCDVMPIHITTFHCGHILAKSKGGSNTLENLRPICQTCNLSMGTMHMDEFKKLIPKKNLNEIL
jgi:hypothetical protein